MFRVNILHEPQSLYESDYDHMLSRVGFVAPGTFSIFLQRFLHYAFPLKYQRIKTDPTEIQFLQKKNFNHKTAYYSLLIVMRDYICTILFLLLIVRVSVYFLFYRKAIDKIL